MASEHSSLAQIIGPWQEPDSVSGLIERVRRAWTKPIGTLSNEELATCLRQAIAVEHLLPIAKDKVSRGVDDGSEIDDGELVRAIEEAEYREKREREHRQIMASRFHTDEEKG